MELERKSFDRIMEQKPRANARSAYILAGGKSSRFGTNKALVQVDGQLLIRKLADELSISGWDVTVVSQSERDYRDLGLRGLQDRIQDSGPLVALATALQDCSERKERWCLVTSCDLVCWNSVWGAQLLKGLSEMPSDGIEHHGTSAYDASSFEHEPQMIGFRSNGFLPFPGLYRTDLLPTIDSLLAGGNRSLRSLHTAISERIRFIEAPETGLPGTFNTQEELKALLKKKQG
jgi:molybdenum cofactor guanylyltransferase